MSLKAELAYSEHLEKSAFFAVTPTKIKSRDEYFSAKGYAKEYVNQTLGGTLGGVVGGIGGAAIGALGGPTGAAIGAGVGVATGGLTGSIRSLRKTEREAKVKQTGLGDLFVRNVASGVGSVVPIVGTTLGDYYASRHLSRSKDDKKSKKK